jgi:malonate decarboxylase epsilon subunit
VVSSLALLFPGQGSQRPGMLTRLRDDAIGSRTLDEAGRVLERDVASLDSADALVRTEATQLALLIAAVADMRSLDAAGIRADFVAGHSVGAFAAAVAADSIEFASALKLVDVRGRAMAAAQPRGFGMAGFVGIPERTLQMWIDEACDNGAQLYLTNRNAQRQFAVSGADADLDALIERARQNGASNAIRLAVAVPSHSPLMASVVPRMREILATVEVRAPRIPYASNRTARLVADARGVLDDLAENVTHPVRWHEIMIALYERGVRHFIEVRPGTVLTRLAESSLNDVRAYALENHAVAALSEVLARERN